MGLVILIAAIVFDQYTKWHVMENVIRIEGEATPFSQWVMETQQIEFWDSEKEKFETLTVAPFLDIVMVWNQGVSFGMFDPGESADSAQTLQLILISLALVICVFLMVWLALVQGRTPSIGIGLVVGGAIGNVIDRIKFGAVADFLDFHYNDMHWPAFNVADACITVGAILIAWHLMFGPKVERDEDGYPVDV